MLIGGLYVYIYTSIERDIYIHGSWFCEEMASWVSERQQELHRRWTVAIPELHVEALQGTDHMQQILSVAGRPLPCALGQWWKLEVTKVAARAQRWPCSVWVWMMLQNLCFTCGMVKLNWTGLKIVLWPLALSWWYSNISNYDSCQISDWRPWKLANLLEVFNDILPRKGVAKEQKEGGEMRSDYHWLLHLCSMASLDPIHLYTDT